ncbi:Phosphatidylglycerophosphatase GEP4, mitochondrial [Grifola frondosa]|uniref:Phosphatidylglycerophosphatase GEP4, mitochondrial n=1 Tax=Grifola frondosa TaxID=5627 RepID=A0A1C7LMB6_GRIFR|nr:Phosphatidylglycerophosphatase GEP4, mitochondrial [Grifola frondosa]
MPINVPGILVPLHLLINPRLIVPSLVVKGPSIKDIRQLDFPELYRAGYRGAVFDKDNCLTLPHQDRLVPELTEAWKECRQTFGEGNVLIVSNTAGSHLDAGDIQAESVTYHLSAPVLRHPSFKPSYACIASIRAYFGSLPTPVRDDELVIVGDRILTDVVLANRMARRNKPQEIAPPNGEKMTDVRKAGPLTVLTEDVWRRESTVLRWMEKGMLRGVERWVLPAHELSARQELRRFVRDLPVSEVSEKREGLWQKLWRTLRKP